MIARCECEGIPDTVLDKLNRNYICRDCGGVFLSEAGAKQIPDRWLWEPCFNGRARRLLIRLRKTETNPAALVDIR